jgi:Ca-activated chloride channel family protein
MADETGGRVIDVGSMKHLQEAFEQISEELRDQYTLGYYPTNSAQDGKFRKIKVETMDKELKVLARKGYYAPKG